MVNYFEKVMPIRFEGLESGNPLAFRWYDKNRQVLGKSMADQLRFAVCYRHSFSWNGFDPFGYERTFERPWHAIAGVKEQALAKAE
jgi:xylose isomerase